MMVDRAIIIEPYEKLLQLPGVEQHAHKLVGKLKIYQYNQDVALALA